MIDLDELVYGRHPNGCHVVHQDGSPCGLPATERLEHFNTHCGGHGHLNVCDGHLRDYTADQLLAARDTDSFALR